MVTKLDLLIWLDKHLFDRITFFLWDISQWFWEQGHGKIADFIDLKIERGVSHRWNCYMFDNGYKIPPRTKTQQKIIEATLGAYLKDVKGE